MATSSQPLKETTMLSTRKHQKQEPSIIVIKALICAYAIKHKVKPEELMAIAHIESRKGKKEFRVGLTGRYYLPMGIHKGCKTEDDKSTLSGNIEIGAKTLARLIHRRGSLKRALQKYNASFNSSYWNQVKKASKKYEYELEHGFDG